MMTNHHSLDNSERSRIVSQIVSLTEEIERLNKEIEELEPTIHYNESDYKKYKLKISTRDAMKQQLADCRECLRV